MRYRNINKVTQGLTLAALILSMTAALVPGASAQDKKAQAPVKPAATSAVRAVDSIVAVINNEVITRQELNARMRSVERRMSNQGAAMPPRAELEKQLLERMIVDRVQMQLAKEVGIHIDDVLLDRAISRIAEQNKMSMQDFRNQLERDGTPFPHFREEIREEITMQRLREREVDNKIQISESEIENYLGADTGAAQQEMNLAQILVRIPENASATQIAQRRQRAEAALQQLRSGSEFMQVAATYSDATEALKGGELGWRSQDRLPQLFLDAVAQLKQGEVSAIVQSANGFHILKLVGKRTASVVKAGAAGGPGAAAAVQQTHARHILIKVTATVTATDARRKLTELKQRLDNKAAKFDDLAKSFSNDLSASKGGDLGWIYPGDTVPEFERAMDALRPGQVSEPIESPFGYHLILVDERKMADVSQERQRMAARQALRERKVEEAAQDWLRQLRDRAYVEYRTEEK